MSDETNGAGEAQEQVPVTELLERSQELGRQIDVLREQRRDLKDQIDARLAAGEMGYATPLPASDEADPEQPPDQG